MEALAQHIEALIFCAEQAISLDEIKSVTEAALEINLSTSDLNNAIDAIKQKYAQAEMAIELVQLAGGYVFLTKKEFHKTVKQLQIHRSTGSPLPNWKLSKYEV
jgi:segregation and condensation protein B